MQLYYIYSMYTYIDILIYLYTMNMYLIHCIIYIHNMYIYTQFVRHTAVLHHHDPI